MMDEWMGGPLSWWILLAAACFPGPRLRRPLCPNQAADQKGALWGDRREDRVGFVGKKVTTWPCSEHVGTSLCALLTCTGTRDSG